VGQFYDDFTQTTDDEVIFLLRRREQEIEAWGTA
jgi:predicted phosphoribosyltransferase